MFRSFAMNAVLEEVRTSGQSAYDVDDKHAATGLQASDDALQRLV